MGTEAVNCRRFLSAWERFQTAQGSVPSQQDAETLYQVLTASGGAFMTPGRRGTSRNDRLTWQYPRCIPPQYQLMAQHFSDLLKRAKVGRTARFVLTGRYVFSRAERVVVYVTG